MHIACDCLLCQLLIYMLGEPRWPVCHVFEPLVDNSGGDLLLQSPHASHLPRQRYEHADVSCVRKLQEDT